MPARRGPDGALHLGFRRQGAGTRLARLDQQGSLRAFTLPAGADGCAGAILLNTAGGSVGGDRLLTRVTMAPGPSPR